jgi:hypothetical protein
MTCTDTPIADRPARRPGLADRVNGYLAAIVHAASRTDGLHERTIAELVRNLTEAAAVLETDPVLRSYGAGLRDAAAQLDTIYHRRWAERSAFKRLGSAAP